MSAYIYSTPRRLCKKDKFGWCARHLFGAAAVDGITRCQARASEFFTWIFLFRSGASFQIPSKCNYFIGEVIFQINRTNFLMFDRAKHLPQKSSLREKINPLAGDRWKLQKFHRSGWILSSTFQLGGSKIHREDAGASWSIGRTQKGLCSLLLCRWKADVVRGRYVIRKVHRRHYEETV